MSIDNLFLLLAFVLSYWKTSELLAAFAPKQIGGFTDPFIPYLYGMLAAALVELFAWYRYSQMKKNAKDTRFVSFVFGMGAVGVAIIANSLDSLVLADRISELSELQRGILTWFIPALPACFLALHFLSAFIEGADIPFEKDKKGLSLADTLFAKVGITPKGGHAETPKVKAPKTNQAAGAADQPNTEQKK